MLILELKELALYASCREAMGESAALSTLTALLAEEDLPYEAHVHAAGALKVCHQPPHRPFRFTDTHSPVTAHI